MPDASGWEQIKNAFEAMLAMPAEERELRIATLALDASLKEELRQLLAAHEREGALDTPPLADPLPDAFRPGSTLGPYTVADVLGAGGMGLVLRAHDARLHRDVAIKVLHAEYLTE